VLFQETELELVDTQGRPMRKHGQTNSATDTGAKIKVTFQGEDDDAAPQLLRVTYPRLRAERSAEIVFHGVPLPTGRPE
jgi:hypothetical protein